MDLAQVPANAPDSDELAGLQQYVDSEDLRWVFRPRQIVRPTEQGPAGVPGVEAICLDDSGLRETVLLDQFGTFDDMLNVLGEDGVEQVVRAIKQEYEEWEPDRDLRS